MMKTVSYDEYSRALYNIQQAAGDMVEIYDMGGAFNVPINLGIHWAARGTVSLDVAEKFAAQVAEAVKLAREFPYNGYTIKG